MHPGNATQARRRQAFASVARDIKRLLAERPSRADLERRGIYRRLRVHITGSYSSGSCNWTRRSSEYVFSLDAGIGFDVATTASGDLVAFGTPQFVSFEALRSCSSLRKRSKQPSSTLCHPPKAVDRKLRRDEAAVLTTSTSGIFPIATCLVPSFHHSVRQVACGVSHCVALVQDETGCLELRSWGLGQYGQLGLGQEVQVATTMAPITTSVELVGTLAANCNRSTAFRLSCGSLSSCLTLTNAVSTSVWLWGLLPSPCDTQSFIHQHIPSADFITECHCRVEQVSLGLAHVVLLDDTGRVFTWGHHSSGQLGLGLQHAQIPVGNSPSEVVFHQRDLVVGSVSCGYDHTLALSRDELQLFVWGSNRLGACGATTKFFEYSHPVLLGLTKANGRIRSISCKAHTSVAVVSGPSTSHVAIWGVCGLDTAHLIPSSVYEVVSKGNAHLSNVAGFGSILALVDNEDEKLLPTSQYESQSDSQYAYDCTNVVTPTPPLVVGMSVIKASLNTRLCDLNWVRPVLHRVRIITGDVVVLLLQSPTPLPETALTLQSSLHSPLPVETTVLHTTPAFSLYLAVLPVETVHQFGLEWQHNEESEPLTLLSVDCCLDPQVRDDVLRTHHAFILACFNNVLETNNKSPFEAFIEAICRNHDVDDAVAYSHLALTVEEDQLQSALLDVDRLAMEKACQLSCLRKRNPEIPSSFGLWEWHLQCLEDESNAFKQSTLVGLSLWDLLITLHEEVSDDMAHLELLYLSIANQLVEWHSRPHPESEHDHCETVDPVTFHTEASAVSLSSPTKLSAPQNAMDFLVSGSKSLAALHEHGLQQHDDMNRQASGIRMWQNDNGDLFYTQGGNTAMGGDARVVHIHLPDDLHDSSRSSAPRNFSYELHRFLWDVIDRRGFSICKLHSHLGSIADSDQLQNRLKHVGFDAVAPHEAWFSTFTMLQRLTTRTTDTKSHRLSLHALRVFLVDPFHDEFFRNYLADWRDAVHKLQQKKGTRFRVRDLLAWSFEFDTLQRVSWEVFLSGLFRLHGDLRWDLLESDACRLLYHFDVSGDGFINLRGFLKCLLGQNNSQTSKLQSRRPTAIDPSRRRPELDTFTTPNAMRKLFQTRAQDVDRRLSNETPSQISRLLHMGNTRLAQIRNLPVSRLLSEGVHFRPRKPKYQGTGSNDSDEEVT